MRYEVRHVYPDGLGPEKNSMTRKVLSKHDTPEAAVVAAVREAKSHGEGRIEVYGDYNSLIGVFPFRGHYILKDLTSTDKDQIEAWVMAAAVRYGKAAADAFWPERLEVIPPH